MGIVEMLKQLELWKFCKTIPLYKNFHLMRAYRRRVEGWTNKNLLPGYLWIDKVDVVVTTACNLLCEG